MCFDGGATGRHRVPGFGQDRSLRRSNFGRTGPQADVDVQAVGECWVLRRRARRVRLRSWPFKTRTVKKEIEERKKPAPPPRSSPISKNGGGIIWTPSTHGKLKKVLPMLPVEVLPM